MTAAAVTTAPVAAAPSSLQNAASFAQIAAAALQPLLPLLGPQAAAAGAVAGALTNALSSMAARGGSELTEADWQAALAGDDAAIADDLLAQQEARARGG